MIVQGLMDLDECDTAENGEELGDCFRDLEVICRFHKAQKSFGPHV